MYMMSTGDRLLLAATVTDVLDGQYIYQACKLCYSKLSYTSNAKTLICRKCGCIFDAVDTYYRYCLHLTAADSSCLANITVFGSLLDKFFGITGSEFYLSHVLKLKSNYGSIADVILKLAIENVFVGQNLIFGYKVPKNFFSKERKNQEILLKDICQSCTSQTQKNFLGALPELTAVQLVPQTNSRISLTVVDSLETLVKRVEEMGYLQANELNYDIMRLLCKQNVTGHTSPQYCLQRNSRESSLNATLNCSQATLRLSCDLSLSLPDENQEPDHSQPAMDREHVELTPVIEEVKTLNTALKNRNETKSSISQNVMRTSDTNCHSAKRSNSPINITSHVGQHKPFKTSCSQQNTLTIWSNIPSRQTKISSSQQSDRIKQIKTNRISDSQSIKKRVTGCFKIPSRALEKRSLHLSNKENVVQSNPVPSKFSKGSSSSQLSFPTSIPSKFPSVSWSVLKYNKSKVNHKLTKVVQEQTHKGQLSFKTKKGILPSSHPERARNSYLLSESSLPMDAQFHLPVTSTLNRSCDRERTLSDNGIATPHLPVDYIQSSTGVFEMEHMPESEDLELFLAAVSSEATASFKLLEGRSKVEEGTECDPDFGRTFNEHLDEVAIECAETNLACDDTSVRFDISNDKSVTRDESFTITDDYAASISFNVTLRRFKKTGRKQISQSLGNADNALTAELPESEDLWQFLEKFPTALNNSDSSTSSHQRLQSNQKSTCLNSSTSMGDNYQNIVNEKILICTINSASENKDSEVLFTKSPTLDEPKSIWFMKPKCAFKTNLHTSSTPSDLQKGTHDSETSTARHFQKVSTPGSECRDKLLVSPHVTTCQTDITALDSAKDSELTYDMSSSTYNQQENSSKDQSWLSADCTTDCTNPFNVTLMSDSLDLFDSSQLSATHSLAECHILTKVQNDSLLSDSISYLEEFCPSKEIPVQKYDTFFHKKVRFSSIQRESYFNDSDSIKVTMKPKAYIPLKSCLKAPVVCPENSSSNIVSCDLSTSPVASQDLFTQDSDLVTKRLGTSFPSCNDSADLFSPSSTPPNDSAVDGKLSLTPGSCDHSVNNSFVRDMINESNEHSLELFSQSPIYINNNPVHVTPAHELCSTPIYMNTNFVYVAPSQDCMTPDLFD